MAASSSRKQTLRDISPREYMYFPKGILEMGKPGQFSRLELYHIITAMIILTIAFTFALSRNSILMMAVSNFSGFSLSRLGQGLQFSLVGIVSAFFCHELSHKLMAQRYGLWSEFRMYPKGLLFSLVLSVTTGFVFATPGAVMFRGEPRIFEEGKIAMAGPLANMVITVIFLPLFIFFFNKQTGSMMMTIGIICLINCIFAVFNLFPFGPLDGVKIFKWSPVVWASMFVISTCMLVILLPFALRDIWIINMITT